MPQKRYNKENYVFCNIIQSLLCCDNLQINPKQVVCVLEDLEFKLM